MKNFKQSITRIFLILGDACNMNCKYCKAHLANSPIEAVGKQQVSSKLLSFLKGQIEKEPTLINFYGGEPLLYFDTIKYIIDTLNDPAGDVIYSTMTNGKAMTPEMAAYLNEKKVTVNFSWDGNNTKLLRGYDVFADEKIRRNILSINDLWINSTLTSLNYPLEILESHKPYLAEYQKIHGQPYGIHIGLATPAKSNDPLYSYDYNRIYEEIRGIFCQYLFQCLQHDFNEMTPIDCWSRTMLFKLQSKAIGKRDICLDMDLNGNFFTCPFSRKTVDTLDTLDAYVEKAWALREKRKCKENCPLVNICDGGCPQLKGTPLFEEGCKLRRAFYAPLLELVTGALCAGKGGIE